MCNMAVGGVAINIAATNPTCAPLIWNPLGSGKIVYILRLFYNIVTANAVGNLNWYYTLNAGAATGATSAIITATTSAPVVALLGSANATTAKTLFAPQTATYSTVPTYFGPAGVSLAATAANNLQSFVDYEGGIALAPGSALTLCVAAACTSVLAASVLIAELPALGNY